MDKIKINNQIVIMRKFVKQAKVHIINKLVKQVKLLQNRKGNEAQVEKCKRKAERYLEEITILKSIKPDNVSKSALSKARDWKEILQQKTSTLDERCLAMLASYGAVQKEVESFHYSNPYFATKIPGLLKEWEEKSKLPRDSPFDKRKKKLDTNVFWKDNNISPNAFEKLFDKEVSPSSIKKIKMGVKEELDELESDTDITQQNISDEVEEHESESVSKSKNQTKPNYNKLLNKISPLKLSENIKSDKSSDEELENDDDVTQESKECKLKNGKKSKNQTNKKIKSKLISNKLQSKESPVKFSETVKSDKSSDEDEDYKLKSMKKNKDTQQKIKRKLDSAKFQSKNSVVKSSKNVETDKSSDEESFSAGENSVNNADLDGGSSERSISESDSSESIDWHNTNEIRGRFKENNVEALKPNDDENSKFVQRTGRKRKLSEKQNFCTKGMAGNEEPDGKMLDKPVTPKQIQSNLPFHSYKNKKESNLKTIAMLSLNDLQGLDEIPVEEKTEDEKTSDEDEEKFPAKKRQDDFFLGKDELDPTCEDRVNVYSKSEKRQKFPRNDESNFEKKSFQKSLNTSQFSRTESHKSFNERNFKKSGFQPRNSTDRFRHKGKREFPNKDQRGLNRKERRALESRNQEDFYMKGKNNFQSKDQKDFDKKERNEFQPGNRTDFNRTGNNSFQVFGKKSYDEQSRKSNFQNERNSSFRKDKMQNIKGNINEKPLHPSWEAKRKLKELTQTRFQGKKIVFDN